MKYLQFRSALALVLMATAWHTFAPLQLGGRAAYVIVNGISMEPGFHRGDLVLLRAADEYNIGDIATYRHPEIGPVIHRIVAREGVRYILQGDNNDWRDQYLPVQSDFIGKLWIRLPGVGKVIARLRSPQNAAVATVAGVLILATMPAAKTGQRGQSGRKQARKRYHPMQNSNQIRETMPIVLAAAALAALVLALFAFTRPVTRTVSDDVAYQQTGVFDYAADAPDGIYDGRGAQTGDPLFRRLTNRVAFSFTYRLQADHPAALQGTHRLVAEISDPSGWRRSVELHPTTAFGTDTFTTSGVLDLAQLQTLLDGVQARTGVHRQQYKVAVGPEVVLKGTLAGQPLQDQFAPRLTFRLDDLEMQLVNEESSVAAPLTPSQEGSVARTRSEANTLSLLRIGLPIAIARGVSVIVLGLSFAGLVAFGVLISRAARRDEAAMIRLKYGSRIISVRDSGLDDDRPVVQVATIDDLAKLADREGRMILHEVRGTVQRFTVQDQSTVYCYTTSSPDDAGTEIDAAVPGRWQRSIRNIISGASTPNEAGEAR